MRVEKLCKKDTIDDFIKAHEAMSNSGIHVLDLIDLRGVDEADLSVLVEGHVFYDFPDNPDFALYRFYNGENKPATMIDAHYVAYVVGTTCKGGN